MPIHHPYDTGRAGQSPGRVGDASVDRRALRSERAVLRTLLRERRQTAGLRQVEVAEQLGVPQSWVAKVEGGERRLDVLELRRLCSVLGIALGAFVRELDARLTTDLSGKS